MIDIVIPTYKRIKHLKLLIRSIEEQSIQPQKTTIVYAGITAQDIKETVQNSSLHIELISSEPSVCKQRNLGIKNATSKYIFLCDDDIELPKNYLKDLYTFLENSPSYNIVTGEEYLLNDKKEWEPLIEKISHSNLWYKYLFGLSIWTDLSLPYYQSNMISRYISNKLIKQGNHVSAGGWPRICKFEYPIMESTIYSLEASMIRTKVLKQHLYNEDLSQYGIGDNYEVVLNINKGIKKVAVLRNVYFKHYKSSLNRISKLNSYTQRIKELKRVVFTSEHFTLKHRICFTWSLFGNSIYFFFKREWKFLTHTLKVIFSIKKNS